jgi:ribosomal protein S18 acetylase RimI-like enzyme
MTLLAPMPLEVFVEYREASIADYARENVAARRWPEAGALERSRADFALLLPQGLATPDHFLFEILANEGGPAVGILWFAIELRHGLRSAFVYDLAVKPEYRRQGHARRAFQALEEEVTALGLARIGLHVFSHNTGAQALYASLGYHVTGHNMTKHLATAEAGPAH